MIKQKIMRYNIIIALLILAAILTGLTSCDESGGSGKYAEVVNVNTSLNLRTEPNTQSRVIVQLKNGERVELCSEVSDGWIKVRADDVTGYVKATYIKALAPERIQPDPSTDSEWGDYSLSDIGSGIWGVLKTIGYIILGIIGLFLLSYILRGAFAVFSFILSMFFTVLGGYVFVGLLGLVFSGFNVNTGSQWGGYGAVVAFIFGVIAAIRDPKEFTYHIWQSSSSDSESGGGSGGSGGGGGSGESEDSYNSVRYGQQVQLHKQGPNQAWFSDDAGNTHWLNKIGNQYLDLNGDRYSEDGFLTSKK